MRRIEAPLSLLIASGVGSLLLMLVAVILPVRAYEIGASSFELGLLGSSAYLIYSFTPFLMGWLSDRVKPQRLITLSLVSLGFVYMAYTSIDSVYLLILARIVEGGSWATFWPCIESAIAERGEIGGRIREFNVSWGLGAMLGAPVAGALSRAGSLTSIFLLSSVISFGLAAYVILNLSFGGEPVEDHVDGGSTTDTLTPLTLLFVSYFTIGVLMAFFPAYGVMEGISVFEVGVITFLLGGFRLAAFLLFGGIERLLREFSLTLASLLVLSFSSMLIWLGGKISYYVGFIGVGAASGVIYSFVLPTMLRRSSTERGKYAGLFESTIGAAYVTGPLVGGVISRFHLRYPFLLCSFFSLLVAVVQVVRCYKLVPSPIGD